MRLYIQIKEIQSITSFRNAIKLIAQYCNGFDDMFRCLEGDPLCCLPFSLQWEAGGKWGGKVDKVCT